MSHSKPSTIRISDISLIGFCLSENGFEKTFFHLKENKKQKTRNKKQNQETRNKKKARK